MSVDHTQHTTRTRPLGGKSRAGRGVVVWYFFIIEKTRHIAHTQNVSFFSIQYAIERGRAQWGVGGGLFYAPKQT